MLMHSVLYKQIGFNLFCAAMVRQFINLNWSKFRRTRQSGKLTKWPLARLSSDVEREKWKYQKCRFFFIARHKGQHSRGVPWGWGWGEIQMKGKWVIGR